MSATRGVRSVVGAASSAVLVAGVTGLVPAAAGEGSPRYPATAGAGDSRAAVTAQPDRSHSVTLRVADADGRVRSRKRVRFAGRLSGADRNRRILFQERIKRKKGPSWQTVKSRRDRGNYRFTHRITEGRHVFRTVAKVPGKDPVSPRVKVVGTSPADFTGMVMPGDAAQVTAAIAAAQQSVEIVIYDLGAQDILQALQTAKARLAANDPDQPVIRVMVNNQWWGPANAAKHYSYVAKMARALGVGSNGKSADGVVQFNYTANNFSLTHQKGIFIDTLRKDGSDYSAAAQLPPSAKAIVATFNLQAYGWDRMDSGCENNPGCGFAGGNPGTRDFGIIANDEDHIWQIQQVFASDWDGPSPAQTNADLGLDDPDSNLVWSNGTTGVLFPAPTGVPTATAAIYSKSAGAYPAWDAGAGVGSGFYPAPYYKFARQARQYPQVQPGTAAGNADQVHLDIIRAAEHAAEAGKPAKLYIYNEEYNDDAVLYAIQDAAAAGVAVRIIMTYSSGNIYNYDDLLTTTTKTPGGKGQPVDVQIHLLPNQTPPYMYVHAKMVYADIGSDLAFVGSQNFSENSLLFNREGGVQLKESDGSLSPSLKSMLLGTFADDLALTGAGVTWTYTDGSGVQHTAPCPVVVGTPADTLGVQSKNLSAGDFHRGGAGAGCQLAPAGRTGMFAGPDPDPSADLVTDSSSPESWHASRNPDFGSDGPSAAPSPGAFAAPLDGVSGEYYPPMPQGPIDVGNMVPGPCSLVSQATGALQSPCPASS